MKQQIKKERIDISQMTNKEALKSFEWSKVAKRLHEQSMYPTKSGEKWLPK